jgi:oligopeptidase A
VDHLDLAHLAVHLEGNERHLAMVALHAEAIAAVTDPGGCRRAADGLRTADPTASPWPLEPWVAELDRRATGADTDRQVEVERSCAEVRAALAAVEAGRRALVERVRGRKTAAPPGAVIGAALAAMDDDTQRRKVIDAWHRMGGRQEPVLADAIDRAVAARRRHAEHSGHLSVADQTFERCRVGVVEVEEFLEDNLARALGRRRDLARSLAETTGATDAPLLHLARAAAAVRGAGPAPRLPLAGCLAAAATVAERVFGMEVRVPDVDGASSLVLPVRTGTDRVGSIRVDLVPAPDRLGDDVEDRHPGRTAHLLAVVDAGDDGPALSFDSARSLFHEVGHALDHLLLTTPWAPRTGLDAGPLERFEEMSTWWELLVFHPDLGRVVGVDADQEDGLARARRLRALETASLDLARAWVALLDLRLHRSATADVATVQADLARCGDDRSRPLGLPDLAGYLRPWSCEHPEPATSTRGGARAARRPVTWARPGRRWPPRSHQCPPARSHQPDLPSWPPDAAALDASPDGGAVSGVGPSSSGPARGSAPTWPAVSPRRGGRSSAPVDGRRPTCRARSGTCGPTSRWMPTERRSPPSSMTPAPT